MEVWLGAPLIDRSLYPTALTPEGRVFRETAGEVLRILENARADASKTGRVSRQVVNIAALHSLALSFIPKWLRDIEQKFGEPLPTNVLADSYHNCIQALMEGSSDFLFTFHHDAVSVGFDSERFPNVSLGRDRFLLVSGCGSSGPLFPLVSTGDELPLLAYSRDSFLGRLSAYASEREGLQLFDKHINDNALAEALKAMALEGHGVAWLPESIIVHELQTGTLAPLGPEAIMEIRLYRSQDKTRRVVEELWAHLNPQPPSMHDRNNGDRIDI